ncbi:uncharacterized protein K452DRAFT_290538 [Aplosporella prunicola CBS 121167]|uniref:SnoaL-like domain-containing protein n=1 Tax=Aplosporella prunicola CBS 121167 TaxID=1176127 RepID=A0A6A6B656_9PEZI|nr:uncharacterized protein K452DRAFT_290538 [Aplosporella prunicola CBS 121167]KAF2138893.1 hypothetical protein K452DRAFT_290538 [Aplosporella prunicola CBS 121167]
MTIQRSTRLNTVYTLLDGYGSLSVSTLIAPLAANFKHSVLPESLGMATRGREAFEQHAAGIFSVFESFAMVPNAIFEDTQKNAVIINAKMEGVMKGGREWANECVMIVQLSEDQREVIEVTEFVDSAKALEMRKNVKPPGFDDE